MKKIQVLFLCLILLNVSFGQYNKYIVKFKNKGSNNFSLDAPEVYLSERSIERRSRYNINFDSTDLPVSPAYLDSIRIAGNVSLLNVSKWLNQVSIETDDTIALQKINQYFFVQQINPIAPKFLLNAQTAINNHPTPIAHRNTFKKSNSAAFDYGESTQQIRIHRADFLHNHGFSGNGMQLAMIDDGFYHYNSLPTFDSVVLNQQILGTWDFVSNNSDVTDDDYHGMHCLSTIAANIPGVFVGSAPKTSFYLFRSEDVNSEYPIEEHNLACAAEKADSLGADVCSISLGYNSFDEPLFDYTFSDMDGNTSMSARAVDNAAKKGMLMVVAAGNEGNNVWHFINTPADADSCMTVGAVNTNGEVAGFSSYGPSSDGQIKPSVASVGWNTVIANYFDGSPTIGSGTSFACPNLAGISTCLWQAFPEASNMEIIQAIESNSSNAKNPDNRTGYGIPDVKKAFVALQKKYFSFQTLPLNCNMSINLSARMDSTMNIIIERKFPTDTFYSVVKNFQTNEPYGKQNFSFTDSLSHFDYSNVTYRFKMIIDNDTTYYPDSSNIFLFIPCKSDTLGDDLIEIFPNPVSTELNLSINISYDAVCQINIVSETGQTIYCDELKHNKGKEFKKINTASFSKGIYFVVINLNGQKRITRKFIKL